MRTVDIRRAWFPAPIAGVFALYLGFGLAMCSGIGCSMLVRDFVLGDHGFLLTVTDEILGGRKLYRDVFVQYGPLPVAVYSRLSRTFGNTVTTYTAFNCALVTLSGLIVSSWCFRIWGQGAGTLLAFSLSPILIWNGLGLSPWHNAEIAIMLTFVAVRTQISERGPGRCAVLGVLLALQQLCKFGSSLTLAVVSFLMDMLDARSGSALRILVWKQYLTILGCWVATLFALFLPIAHSVSWPILEDQLWPSYLLRHYSTWATQAALIQWFGWRVMVTRDLPIILGLAVAAMSFKEDRQWTNGVSVHVLPAWFAVSACFYLPTRWHLYGYGVAALCGLLPAGVERRRRTTLICALLFPGCFAATHALLVAPPGNSFTVTANGERLKGTQAEVQDLQAVTRSLKGLCAPPPSICRVAVIGRAPGLNHFTSTRIPVRHAWFMEGMMRADEEEEVASGLEAGSAVVLALQGFGPGLGGAEGVSRYGLDLQRPEVFLPFHSKARSIRVARALSLPPEVIGQSYATYRVVRSSERSRPAWSSP